MLLKRLRLTNLGPFDEIEFDEHVNVFTGPNNSGKSTALMALGEIVVLPFGMPRKLLRTEAAEFELELGPDGTVFTGHLPRDLENSQHVFSILRLMPAIGYSSFVPAIRRSTDFRAKVPVQLQPPENPAVLQPLSQSSWPFLSEGDPEETAEQRGLLKLLSLLNSEATLDLHKKSEEMRTQVEEVGDEDLRRRVEKLHKEMEGLRKLRAELSKRLKLIKTDASSISDETVIQKIIELDYRAYRRGKPEIRGIVEKTVAIASEVTEGYPIRFVRVDEDDDGLVPLNVLSQGTQSLVQWLARLLMSLSSENVSVSVQ